MAEIDHIVDFIAQQCEPWGLVLVDPAEIAETIIRCVPCWRDAPEDATQLFVNLLIQKLRERCAGQDAAKETKPAN